MIGWILAVGCLFVAEAEATEIGARPFGLGVIVGDPTGLSGKYYLNGRKNAIDGALAFDTYGDDSGWIYLHGTYLWHPSVLAGGGDVEIPWHVGVGGFVASGYWRGRGDDDDAALGVRVPVGLDFDLNSIPLQFFADVALQVGITPGTDVDFDLGIGGRYYF